MAINKVVYDGNTLIDLTADNVTADKVFKDAIFHGADGALKTGTFTVDDEVTTQQSLIEQIKTALQGKASGGGGAVEPDYRDIYQRVEYITSTEENTYPYIITDFIADNTCGVEVIGSFPVMQDRIPMGSRVDSGANRFYCVYPLSASTCYFGFNTGSSISCALSLDTVYRLQTNFLNSRLVNIYDTNGIRKGGTTISATLVQQTCPVAIFGYYRSDTDDVTSKREYKLYSARISKGHEVVREYIPCYRKSDGEIGLYEKFTGEFLTAADGGEFAKGADIEWQ